MATYTENYNLTLPEEEDYYDVSVFNENTETIDALFAENEHASEEISAKIGESEDTGTDTIFGKLNQMNSGTTEGMTAVKSIQHVFYTIPMESSGGSVAINAVDPQKSFVLFELMCEQVSYIKNVKYTLNATDITVSHSYAGNAMDVGAIVYGFWVIELC